MSDAIFRKVSLERLASPEELDQLVKVTGPRAYLALAALLCVLGTAILWGFLGNIPTKTEGKGILMASGGIENVVNASPGRVTDVRVKSGDLVKKGDVVVRIDQPEIVDEINGCKKDLEAVKVLKAEDISEDSENNSSSLSGLYDLARKIRQEKASLNAKQKGNSYDLERAQMKLNQSVASLEQSKVRLEQAKMNVKKAQDDVEKKKALLEKEGISRSELEEAVNSLKSAEIQADIAAQDVKTAEASAATDRVQVDQLRAEVSEGSGTATQMSQSRLSLSMLESQFNDTKASKIAELEKKVRELTRKLETDSTVISHVDGRVLEVNVKRWDIVQAGSSMVSVVKEGELVNNLEVVLYVPAGEGKKVVPGMEAQISPTIVKKEDYGFMEGKVTWVSEYPSTSKNMLQTLGSQELVQDMSKNGTPIEVHVNLVPDATTYSGFKWSTARGAPVKIDSGNICNGTILVSDQKPIEMVIPYIKEKLNID